MLLGRGLRSEAAEGRENGGEKVRQRVRDCRRKQIDWLTKKTGRMDSKERTIRG